MYQHAPYCRDCDTLLPTLRDPCPRHPDHRQRVVKVINRVTGAVQYCATLAEADQVIAADDQHHRDLRDQLLTSLGWSEADRQAWMTKAAAVPFHLQIEALHAIQQRRATHPAFSVDLWQQLAANAIQYRTSVQPLTEVLAKECRFEVERRTTARP